MHQVYSFPYFPISSFPVSGFPHFQFPISLFPVPYFINTPLRSTACRCAIFELKGLKVKLCHDMVNFSTFLSNCAKETCPDVSDSTTCSVGETGPEDSQVGWKNEYSWTQMILRSRDLTASDLTQFLSILGCSLSIYLIWAECNAPFHLAGL